MTSGLPVEYFQALSARTPAICAHCGSPAATLAARPGPSSCEQSEYWVAPTECGTSGTWFAESGLKPKAPNCSLK